MQRDHSVSRRGHIDVDAASIYYETYGNGHPLVLIHGWTLNSRMWDDQMEALGARYCVVRYDRRGFGKSSGDPATEKDPDDLNALLTHLRIPSAYVLGMSQGGWCATYFALDYPDRTDALILNGAVLPGLNLPFAGPDRVPSDRYLELSKTRGMAAMRDAWLDHPLFAVARTMPEVRSRLADLVAEYSGADLARVKSPAFGDRRDAVLRLGQIQIPTLVLIGEHEAPYLKIVAQAQAYAIPHVTMVVLPGCDHVANMVAPEAYNAAVLRFLAGVDPYDADSGR